MEKINISQSFYYKNISTDINHFLVILNSIFNNVEYQIQYLNKDYVMIKFSCVSYDENEEKASTKLESICAFMLKEENIHPFLEYLSDEYNKIGKKVTINDIRLFENGTYLAFYNVYTRQLIEKESKNYSKKTLK